MTRFARIAVLLALVGCGDSSGNDDGGSGDGTGSADSTAADDSAGTTTGPAPESGLLGCMPEEACTIVIASQALDDRVEVYSARGSGPVYRGAIDFDLKPNPGGDNEGENLDEPFGLALGPAGLSVLLGHYPMRNLGSLVQLPHEFLADHDVGATIPQADFFAAGAFVAPVADAELGEEEPIFMLRHPSGRLLVAAFENDLFALETEWTNPGKLLVIDPADTSVVGKRTLEGLEGGGCAGAWSIVALDDSMNRVAVSCDGDDGAAVLDVSGIGEGTVEAAAAAVDGCVADVLFSGVRVRALAADGMGGFLVIDHQPNATGEPGHLWRFDGDCQLLGMGMLDGTIFEVREVVRWSVTAGTRWLMSSGRTDARGVHVLKDGDAGPEVCAKLTELDAFWPSDNEPMVLEPYAIALAKDGTGVAVSAGEGDPQKDIPGYGRVLWAELDASVDPCAETPVVSVTDLTADAPAVDAGDPVTWRRGPNVLFVQQYGP